MYTPLLLFLKESENQNLLDHLITLSPSSPLTIISYIVQKKKTTISYS